MGCPIGWAPWDVPWDVLGVMYPSIRVSVAVGLLRGDIDYFTNGWGWTLFVQRWVINLSVCGLR